MSPSATKDPFQTDDDSPTYGKRLLPVLLDDLARNAPSRIYASIPTSQSYSTGLRDVSMAAFARAVDRVSWWMEEQLGSAVDFPTIAYLGPTDIRYSILVIAAIKTQYKIMLPAPRNSIDGMLSLLEATNCQRLLRAASTKVDHIQSRVNVEVLVVPELDELLNGDGEAVYSYPYHKAFEQAQFDPVIVLHTSGTTGLPKPIELKHGGLLTVDAHRAIKPFKGYEGQLTALENYKQLYCAFPPFHAAGIGGALLMPFYFELSLILPPAGRPMGADLLADLLDNVKVDAGFFPPSILEDVCDSPEILQKLKKIKYIVFGGGPLATRAGNIISKYTILRSALGSTETLQPPQFIHAPENWAYFHANPHLRGIQFRERPDGLHELFLVRDPETDKLHSAWYTFPTAKEYSMKDCYAKHPTEPNLWVFKGRGDNIVVLSNGEKFNPVSMEDTIREDPDVREVIVFGQSRFETAALIEQHEGRHSSGSPSKKGLTRLLTYIEKANAEAPGYARLQEDRILFTKPGKPMLRTEKGTVKQAATLKAYEKEIEELYTTGSSQDTESLPKLNARDEPSLRSRLLDLFRIITKLRSLTEDEDFFAAGIDSLQVMKTVRQLKASLGSTNGIEVSPKHITPSVIYSNPTIRKLSRAVWNLGSQSTNGTQCSSIDHLQATQEMYDRYAHMLPPKAPAQDQVADKEFTVVLTGSTGSLGSYLLDSVVRNLSIARVYCLNRALDGEAKQTSVSAARGLPTTWGSKVTFLHTDLSKENLGLSAAAYEKLTSRASFIIHNQWPVDFNLSLSTFEPHIRGVVNLLTLSSASPKRPPILYTSSIATVANWTAKHPSSPVPEGPIHDYSIPIRIGYGQSKYISERLLESAGEVSGVNAAICRVGQIAGPVNKSGVWNKQEWFPSLVTSSKYLGVLPDSLGVQDKITWIPVDILANIIVELIVSDCASTAERWTVFHNLENPHPTTWQGLLPAVRSRFPADAKVIPYETWLRALQDSADSTTEDEVSANPAVKLLDFFEGLAKSEGVPEMSTEETARRSEAMAGLGPVEGKWVERWMEGWGVSS
ncbi:hypothetical protein MMC30_000187 [Trapelia coarctata]|nr:hypothetical protein [Trapelia coarctata]